MAKQEQRYGMHLQLETQRRKDACGHRKSNRPAAYTGRHAGLRGAIEASVKRALAAADNDPRIPRDREARLALLHRGLIPWLAGIDPETGSPVLDRAEWSVEPHGHIAATDIKANAGNADLLLISNDAANGLRIAKMAIGTDNAGHNIADACAMVASSCWPSILSGLF